MKYDVTIQRAEYREHTFQVEADSEDMAHDAAMEAVCDYNFLDSPVITSNEDVTSIMPCDDSVSWCPCHGSMGQGLITEENTGRNIAVAYDWRDAPLLAAAPELLDALTAMLKDHRTDECQQPECDRCDRCDKSKAAVRKAEDVIRKIQEGMETT